MADVGKMLHFRIFDGDGKLVLDIDENERRNKKSKSKSQGATRELVPSSGAGATEKCQVITAVTAIVEHTIQK